MKAEFPYLMYSDSLGWVLWAMTHEIFVTSPKSTSRAQGPCFCFDLGLGLDEGIGLGLDNLSV